MNINTGKNLASGNIFNNLIYTAVPICIALVLNMGYGIIDRMWIGNMLGENHLAAATMITPIINLMISIISGGTLGISIIISQSFGGGKLDYLKKVTGTSIMFYSLLSIVVIVIAFIFSKNILIGLDTPDSIFNITLEYLRISLIGMIAVYLFYIINSILNGVGDVKTPIKILLIAIVINAILDPILINIFELKGAAIATLTAQVIAFIYGVVYLWRKKIIDLTTISIKIFDYDIVKQLLRIGGPAIIQQCLLPISNIVVTSLVANKGTYAIAAFGICGLIDFLAIIPTMAVGNATSLITGQNIGARKDERIDEIYKSGICVNLVINIILAIIIFSIPQVILGMFTDKKEVIEIGVNYLRIMVVGYIFFALSFVSNGVINGSGKTVVTAIISFFSLCIVRVPIAMILIKTSLGLTGIWVAILLSYIVTMIISFIYYKSKKWVKEDDLEVIESIN
ncbi:MATE family efflux transporter [Clostridium sp. LP20]|uniref:MATE family efflux transporter n=1 Tax=Clostridium sp. LP20 TaxID=3418665 RepID=UPI003EE43FD1